MTSTEQSLATFRLVGKIAAILLVLALIITAWYSREPRGSRGIQKFVLLKKPDLLHGSKEHEVSPKTPLDFSLQPEGKGIRVESASYPLSVKAGEPFIPVSCKVSRGTGIGRILLVPLVVLLDKNARELREKTGDTPVELESGQNKDEIRVNLPIDGIASGSYFLAVIPTDPETGKKIGKGIHRQPVEISGIK